MSDAGDHGRGSAAGRNSAGGNVVNDEVSLFDLWAVLARRKAVIFLTGLAVILMAGLYGFIAPPEYTYSTAIEIGSYVKSPSEDSGGRVPLEPTVSARQRLEIALVPMARREFDDPESEVPEVSVSSNDSSEVVAFSSKSELAEQDRVAALHQRIADLIVESHGGVIANIISNREQLLEERQQQLDYIQEPVVQRSRIQPLEEALAESERRLKTIETDYQAEKLRFQNQLEEAKFDLANLRDQQKLFKGQITRLDKERAMAQEQLARQQSALDELVSSQIKATGESADAPEAINIVMLSSQVDQAQSRVDQLQNQLEIGLPRELDELTNRVEENLRAQARATNEINALSQRLVKIDSDYKADLADQQARIEFARTQLEDEKLKYRMAVEDASFEVRAAKNNIAEIIPTRVLFVAFRSLKPTGPSRILILILSVILGGMLGLFAAFAVEFVSRANQYVRDSG